MPEEFACPNCGSPSVVYPDAGEDDGRVECRACGAFLATRGQFRRFVESRAARLGEHTTGC
jgi:transcription elongation factor Elf1